MKILHRPPASLLVLCWATAARAFDTMPLSDPQALGFSSSRLARIAAWQQTQVDAGAFSGAVAAIARNGRVAYLRAVGFRDRAKTIPLQPNAIFWIASMTKPVTSVAAMMLVEDGKLDLAAPVHQYLPELKDMMVRVETTDPANGQSKLALEPQNHQPPKAGAAGPPLQGLLPSHTRPPRSTAGNTNSAGCLKTGPQYRSFGADRTHSDAG